mmetsp:Transcript_11601/g.24836  ORF Transcript_11601/g.24836 Transcript_11601/m.24836 type:complete len:208 (+) Transcript_11601:735-1358(+)
MRPGRHAPKPPRPRRRRPPKRPRNRQPGRPRSMPNSRRRDGPRNRRRRPCWRRRRMRWQRRRRGSGRWRKGRNGRRPWWAWLPRRSRQRSRPRHRVIRVMAMHRARGTKLTMVETMVAACSPFYREGMLPKSLRWRSLSKSRPRPNRPNRLNLHHQRSALPPSAYSIHSRPLPQHPWRRRRRQSSRHPIRLQRHQKPWRRAPPPLPS